MALSCLLAFEARLGGATIGLGPFLAWDAFAIVSLGTALLVLGRFGKGVAVHPWSLEQFNFASWAAVRIGALSSLVYVIVALEYEQPSLLGKRIGIGLTGLLFGGLLSLFFRTLSATRSSAAAVPSLK